MNNVHAIIYAYHGYADLMELGAHRTGASMPFCGRYRLIDFALSSMMNAGIHDVGVIMQKGYQSLLDHIGNGRTWDMARHIGGITLLPPYGLPDATQGLYEGNMEALQAVSAYLKAIRQEYIILMRGDLCANLDFEDIVAHHIASGADVTAVCTHEQLQYTHHSFLVGPDGLANTLLCLQGPNDDEGVATLEVYVMKRDTLLDLVDWCSKRRRIHFNRDAVMHLMQTGSKIGVYFHKGYARHIVNVYDYYEANMDMLNEDKRRALFPEKLPIYTPAYVDVSTYYDDSAAVSNSLIADGCVIQGRVENCVLFSGVHIGSGSVLKNCIILNDTVIGENVALDCVIADKNITIEAHTSLSGNNKLPLVIPKGSKI